MVIDHRLFVGNPVDLESFFFRTLTPRLRVSGLRFCLKKPSCCVSEIRSYHDIEPVSSIKLQTCLFF